MREGTDMSRSSGNMKHRKAEEHAKSLTAEGAEKADHCVTEQMQSTDGSGTTEVTDAVSGASEEVTDAVPGASEETADNVSGDAEPLNRTDCEDKNDTSDKKSTKKTWHVVNRTRPGLTAALWAAFVILIAAVAGLGAAYLYGASVYRTRFYPNTTINGVDVSKMTAEEARAAVLPHAETYELTIIEKDGAQEVLSAEELGWNPDDNGRFDQIISAQDPEHWYLHIREPHSYEEEIIASVDTVLADQAIAGLTCLTDYVRPADAQLVKLADGTYEAREEIEGSKLWEEKATDAIFSALETGAESVDLTNPDCYQHPEVTLAGSSITERAETWNRLLTAEISVQFGNGTETVSGGLLKQYITDDGQSVSFSEGWIVPMVVCWAEKYNTYGAARGFTTHAGNRIVLPEGGTYGRYLDVSGTAEAVREAISEGGTREIEAVWLRKGSSSTDDFGEVFIEVSLSEQKLWLHRSGAIVYETDIVSGLPVSGRETETGLMTIEACESDAVADPVETGGTEAVIQHKLLLSKGIYISDASWRSEFGGNVYLENGTHGSIAVPENAMQQIAEAASEGIAVIIY